MKKSASFFVVSLLLALAVVVSARPTDADIPAPPIIGSTIADFASRHEWRVAFPGYASRQNGTVLIFIAVQCPVSNAYNERMEKLAQDYKARGINVVGINANSTESAADVKDHASRNKLTFTILKDNGNKIADALGATRTPEAYFLDATNKLLYHGRIDNSRDITQVNSSELRDALEATLAGKPVPKTTANAFGCSIKRPE